MLALQRVGEPPELPVQRVEHGLQFQRRPLQHDRLAAAQLARGQRAGQRLQRAQAAPHRPADQQAEQRQADQQRQGMVEPQRAQDVVAAVVALAGADHQAVARVGQGEQAPAVAVGADVAVFAVAGLRRGQRGEVGGGHHQAAGAVEYLEADLGLERVAAPAHGLHFGRLDRHQLAVPAAVAQHVGAFLAKDHLQRAGRLRQPAVGQFVDLLHGAPEAEHRQRQQHRQHHADDQPAQPAAQAGLAHSGSRGIM